MRLVFAWVLVLSNLADMLPSQYMEIFYLNLPFHKQLRTLMAVCLLLRAIVVRGLQDYIVHLCNWVSGIKTSDTTIIAN